MPSSRSSSGFFCKWLYADSLCSLAAVGISTQVTVSKTAIENTHVHKNPVDLIPEQMHHIPNMHIKVRVWFFYQCSFLCLPHSVRPCCVTILKLTLYYSTRHFQMSITSSTVHNHALRLIEDFKLHLVVRVKLVWTGVKEDLGQKTKMLIPLICAELDLLGFFLKTQPFTQLSPYGKVQSVCPGSICSAITYLASVIPSPSRF